MIIRQFPEAAPAAPAAYTFAAECYNDIGDSVKSLEYFNTVAECHPQYEFADYALYMVSRVHRQLRE
jgi:hypothetical protein